jgi:hypothetical protein
MGNEECDDHSALREYHPRQWVDGSSPAYRRSSFDCFLEYHPRQRVDGSSPAYEASNVSPSVIILPLRFKREGNKMGGPFVL